MAACASPRKTALRSQRPYAVIAFSTSARTDSARRRASASMARSLVVNRTRAERAGAAVFVALGRLSSWWVTTSSVLSSQASEARSRVCSSRGDPGRARRSKMRLARMVMRSGARTRVCVQRARADSASVGSPRDWAALSPAEAARGRRRTCRPWRPRTRRSPPWFEGVRRNPCRSSRASA